MRQFMSIFIVIALVDEVDEIVLNSGLKNGLFLYYFILVRIANLSQFCITISISMATYSGNCKALAI